MVDTWDVDYNSPWAQLPLAYGDLVHMNMSDPKTDDRSAGKKDEDSLDLDSPDAAREMCGFCKVLNWKMIARSFRTFCGQLLKPNFGTMAKNASICKLCRMLKQSIEERNAGQEIDPSYNIVLSPVGQNNKRMNQNIYALTVNLIPRKIRLKKGRKLDTAGFKAGIVAVFIEDRHSDKTANLQVGSISGRKVHEATEFGPVRSWLVECRDNHVKCKDNKMYKTQSMEFANDTHARKTLPTRTLFIAENPNSEFVYLQEHSGEREDYVALSYCWGTDATMIMTTKDNIQSHMQGIRTSSFPRTFQDAIKVTREIGLKHLWIDSLCIIQDDKKDWEHEANLMGRLYSGAMLTIAALSSSSADGGLFFQRNITKEVVGIPFSTTNSDFEDMTVYLQLSPLVRTNSIKLEEEAHSKRAWTLQERLLSPRVLYCASLQYYWECREMKRVEDGSVFPEDIARMSKLRQGSLIGSLTASHSKKKALDLWYEVVLTYSWRQMTFEEDKLTALGGLVKTFAAYIKAPYIDGLWATDLAQALAWRRSRRCEALRRPENTRAPSWSWAAVDGGLNYFNQRFFSNAPPPAWRDLLEHPEFLQGHGKTVIKVTGLVWSDPKSASVNELLDVRANAFLDDGSEGTSTRLQDCFLTCLVLADVPSNQSRAHVLLLIYNQEKDSFERIGIADIRDFQPLKARMSKKRLSLT